MLKPLLLFLLLAPIITIGQIKISGKIVNQADKKPVNNASAFLNNSVASTTTGNDGTFTLVNIRPGQYTLIVSVVGFEPYNQTLLVTDKNIISPEIALIPKTILLQEVVIKPTIQRALGFDTFTALFLGTSKNSKLCNILNTNAIDISYEGDTLKASSTEFIIIENKALGYLIKYKLNKFSYTPNQLLYFDGFSAFEELKGTDSQKSRWKKRRLETYQGSEMHFLRSVIADLLEPEGFKIVRLLRTPNPHYKPGGLKMIQTLNIKEDIPLDQYASKTDVEGLFAMGFAGYLYVMYTKKYDFNPESSIFRPKGAPSYSSTIVTFVEPHIFFDRNGTIVNPHAALLEGAWGINRVADMLPVDYVADIPK